MASFAFYTRGAAHGNTPGAVLRESTRMCIIAKAMSLLGHTVRIADAPKELEKSNRWVLFSSLSQPAQPGDITVKSAETLGDLNRADVGVKTSIGGPHDHHLASFCSLFVSYADSSDRVPPDKLLKVPFLVCDRVVSTFVEDGMLDAYISDDIEAIRDKYCTSDLRDTVGGVMHGSHYRKEFCRDLPSWMKVEFYESHAMTARDHMAYLSGCVACIALKGDVTKTYLPPLLALLGCPMVVDTVAAMESPRLRHLHDCYVLSPGDPDNVSGLEKLLNVGDEVYWWENAQDNYLKYWSPLGQALQIAERFQ